MTTKPPCAPAFRAPVFHDLSASLAAGWQDFIRNPITDIVLASPFVITGLMMVWITFATGQTFWLVLAVLGFPLIGALAAIGFYEVSRRGPYSVNSILAIVWAHRTGQLPWLAVIIVVVFLGWFFLGHMIFALFLGLSPMTNVSTSLDVFLTTNGLYMLVFGSAVGGVFALLVFAISVLGMPMILDHDVDFVTAMWASISAVMRALPVYLAWGAIIAAITLPAMIPAFFGLFVAMPVLGHATWHLYQRLSV